MRHNVVERATIRGRRDVFVRNINEDRILTLASNYHGGDKAEFFMPPRQGRFNANYFVGFPGFTERWVIRFPLQPHLAMDSKLHMLKEKTAIELIAEKTTIPVPKVIGHCLDNGHHPQVPPFIIIEYIGGEPLSFERFEVMEPSKRQMIIDQLADYYGQLRRMTYSRIGSLSPTMLGPVDVTRGPVNPMFNDEELEGTQPSTVRELRGPQGMVSSATEYAVSLLGMMQRTLRYGAANTTSGNDARDKLYYLSRFEAVVKGWIDESLDEGPFVLSFGDLHERNIILDENLRIQGILNWAWSRVVPLQFFYPPRWLAAKTTSASMSPAAYGHYVQRLDVFREAVRRKELRRFGNTLLSDDWSRIETNGGLLIPAILDDLDIQDMYHFGYKFLDNEQRPTQRIKDFIGVDPARWMFVMEKIVQRELYVGQCNELRRPSPDRRGPGGYLPLECVGESMASRYLFGVDIWAGQSFQWNSHDS
ncbi:hypothetical protein S7711_11194 [Stachybotrys chartarum IBT 7711]|uniref:Aminoglycoside phosphotransferase domain-containing protein n=1 Tax=Stachybotrys chartarum (strain CBS 109288 / IBT 7711) TaxID=1280523 RepID=A0A084ASQ2_STACB|nr:hypothetical protein S7711_11194 [Stachybotrys chartarum IBT 7711]